ncbi:MAG: tRNA (N6-isopentenyl adenosine(37)-C2)-methylthiotransferase MiaB, partial [Prevotellaceae bacterium]|nr:tRNA (N6-isopentenyl adenosine(37)-C2)-methylthiotransferase MiaB [Prevotellaceae bacterium]
MENKTFYIETYGCQMNVNDSEVVVAILKTAGYRLTERMNEADMIFINTCSIR